MTFTGWVNIHFDLHDMSYEYVDGEFVSGICYALSCSCTECLHSGRESCVEELSTYPEFDEIATVEEYENVYPNMTFNQCCGETKVCGHSYDPEGVLESVCQPSVEICTHAHVTIKVTGFGNYEKELVDDCQWNDQDCRNTFFNNWREENYKMTICSWPYNTEYKFSTNSPACYTDGQSVTIGMASSIGLIVCGVFWLVIMDLWNEVRGEHKMPRSLEQEMV